MPDQPRQLPPQAPAVAPSERPLVPSTLSPLVGLCLSGCCRPRVHRTRDVLLLPVEILLGGPLVHDVKMAG